MLDEWCGRKSFGSTICSTVGLGRYDGFMDGVILRMEDIMLGVGIFDVEVSVDVLVLKWVVYDTYIWGRGDDEYHWYGYNIS